MIDQDAFVKTAMVQLDAWAEQVKTLQDKMAEAGAEGQAQMQAQVEAFEGQRKQAEKMLTDMGKANAAAWQDMQSGVQEAWKALEKSVTDAASRYKP